MADDDTGSPSPWADLQLELLAIVLRRLPSLADRVRLRAVCRAWRRELLPVPFPWLALPDGTSFLSVPDGAVHRLPFPALLPDGGGGDGGLTTCHGSVGSWLFLGVGRSMSLANPFTGDVVPLPDVATICRYEGKARDDYLHPPSAFKLVQLAPPSPLGAAPPADSLFAVLMPAPSRRSSMICICRPPAAATAFVIPGGERAYDAAFYDGKLYAIAYRQLYMFDVDTACKGKPAVPPMRCIANFVNTRWGPFHTTVGDQRYSCRYCGYLVESGGRLLQVRRLIGHLCSAPRGHGVTRARTLSFEVFEADLRARFCFPWRRVAALGGGQALFVGKHSKSVTASECGAREDCIYFLREYCGEEEDSDPLGDSGVFDMRNGRITPLLPEAVAAPPLGGNLGRGRPAWFFQMELIM
ncbi:hypothetical protein SETIT_4G060300v2 [Setaria italica]|uniref:KIB1-4 beta-propeller domain-containing protein n=2 Tax=Setaria TaxID=4554 RepID=K3Y272_SETIT|nr:uncharacterized protein LOC101766371 [Setaria italica]XP_034590505.1 uncharacterized protein LOC117852507 [Setaria viridis]RCV20495.1 hypothetical protein SETIT_4G060300v2 [Setaria italica]TKW20026.1 hypothetical protein SEVIR_4G058400v2 [Setaria viridis]